MKKLLLVGSAILVLLAIPLTMYLALQRQEMRSRAAPATTISFLPNDITKNVGETFTLEARIDTADNQVVTAEIHIIYDATVLQAESITNGPMFPNIYASGVVEPAGTASITVMVSDPAQPVTGTQTVAVVRFRALAPTTGPISISFDPTTYIGAIGETETNALVSRSSAMVTVLDSSIDTSLNTTPTLTPTLIPTLPADLGATDSSNLVGNQSTPSALTVIRPVENETYAIQTPTFSGQAPAGTVVTLTIYSDPITTTVTADALGNWTWTPTTALADGPHTLVASMQDTATQQTITSTTNFVVVASGTDDIADDTVSEVIPTAGSIEQTLLLIGLSIVLIIGGAMVPLLLKY